MPDPMRLRLERAEEQTLAPYALRSASAGRRYPVEDEGRAFDYRTSFQRDRDRIVYSRAFRRLRQKAQVGILPAYEDHRRNRLTHTLEVSQLARTIGRALRLNEDLIEAIALGHDLGQPAFGAAGERVLDEILRGRLDPDVPADPEGFSRPLQSLRVVDRIEKRYRHPGLNLTDPVREGILKSAGGETSFAELEGLRAGLPPLFEAQTVSLADRISTALHDLDDALQSGALELGRVERLAAVRRLARKLGVRYARVGGRFMKANAIHRGLVHLLVTSVVLHASRALERFGQRAKVTRREDFERVRDTAVGGGEVALPAAARRMLDEIEALLDGQVRRGRDADRVEARSRAVLAGLFRAYRCEPRLLDDHVLLRYRELAGGRFLRDLPRDRAESEIATRYRSDVRFARVLADHLASMTDAFALAEHANLLAMGLVSGAPALASARTID